MLFQTVVRYRELILRILDELIKFSNLFIKAIFCYFNVGAFWLQGSHLQPTFQCEVGWTWLLCNRKASYIKRKISFALLFKFAICYYLLLDTKQYNIYLMIGFENDSDQKCFESLWFHRCFESVWFHRCFRLLRFELQNCCFAHPHRVMIQDTYHVY